MASFGGEVGQLEECRLIGNTEVNGKYAITSVFFLGLMGGQMQLPK